MTTPTTPAKLPQWKNDLAVVLRVAIGPRNYMLTWKEHDDRFTPKMQRQFHRVARAVNLTALFGTSAVLRDDSKSRHAFPIIATDNPREFAVALLEEYTKRGGRT